jgi:SAM-dependent methyltransferase
LHQQPIALTEHGLVEYKNLHADLLLGQTMKVVIPPVTKLADPVSGLRWEEYIASGLPGHIGSFHLCLLLNALHETGIARAMQAHDAFTVEQIAGANALNLVTMSLRYLTVRGVIEPAGQGSYRLTELGGRLLCEVGQAQLQFYVGAYSPVTLRLTELLSGAKTYPVDVMRDGRALGAACDTLFTIYHTPIIAEIISELTPNFIVDLGCGGGRLLIDACSHFPSLNGIGIDISEGAIDLARSEAANRNLSDRLSFELANAFEPATWPAAAQTADVIVAVGAVHEHFRDGEDAVVNILNSYADLLRRHGGRAFILGEPELRYDDLENDADLHLVHIFTAQGFPRPREQWMRVIDRSELRCERVYTRDRIGPRFCFYQLVP